MAFLKREKKKSGTYLKIVESHRNNSGKSAHRTLYNLGKAEDYSPQALRNLGKAFLELAGVDVSFLDTKNLRELARYNYGFIQIYNRILQIYGINKFIADLTKKKKLNFNLYQSLLLMIAEQLNEPSSKLSNYNNQSEYLGLEQLELHNLYRSLDHLCDNQNEIQKLIYQQGRNLFNQQLDIVFYDVTTFYFDSEKEDGFRMKGFSKDGKIGNTVIVFGLLIDKDKNPIGYRIYKGGYYEGYTFADAVRQLKQEYSIDRIITVADRGMMNSDNIKLLNNEDVGYEYIIGERLKNLPNSLQDKILDRSKYSRLTVIDEETGEDIEIEYYETEHDGKRIITTYSEKRSCKDRHEREERIDKAKQYIQAPSKIERKAASHYLKKNEKSKYELDEAKIARSERFDGFISISTNTKDIAESEIIESYKQLYKIEHTFRTFKSYLEARPMFHWTQKRIEGHLCLCYICFTLLNYLQQRLRRKGTKISENKLRVSVGKMQLSLIEQNGEQFYLRSRQDETARMIINELNLKELPDIIGRYGINQYISIA
jgi:transposase